MKLLISFLLSIFILCSNLYASENSRDNFIEKSKENTQEIKPKLSNEQLQELIKKLPRENSVTQNTSNEDWFKKLRPFIVPLLIVLYLIFRSDSKTEDRPKKNTKTRSTRSRTEDFVKKHNKDHQKDEMTENFKDFFETNDDKKYEDEWNYDQQESNSLQIKIEKQQVETLKVFDVMAFGMLGFTKDQIDQTKLEKEEAKFTCYVFDVTDKDNETPLQGLTDPYKDDSFLLSSNRNMKVGFGFAYNEWSPMFRFPVHLVVPPYRGKRKIKFIVSATKINAKFENGLIKKKKDLYFDLETIFELNFEEPGYLEAKEYDSEVDEKIVQLGMALAYSEKKINTSGIEAIKNWINFEVLYKDFSSFTDQKVKYSFLLKNTHQMLKENKLSLSEIVKEINFKSSISKRYDAMNLLLNIAGSDDRLSKEEDKLLNNIARALELDLNRFQEMKTSTIANIETIDQADEDNEETIFNFSKDMTDADKCKKLREEYTRWNRQTNNSNEKIRNQARKMVELTANLRKKYNC